MLHSHSGWSSVSNDVPARWHLKSRDGWEEARMTAFDSSRCSLMIGQVSVGPSEGGLQPLFSRGVRGEWPQPCVCSDTTLLCFWLCPFETYRNATPGHKRTGVNTESQCWKVVLTAESSAGIVQPGGWGWWGGWVGGVWDEANTSEGHQQVTVSRMYHKTAECHSLWRRSVKMKVCVCVFFFCVCVGAASIRVLQSYYLVYVEVCPSCTALQLYRTWHAHKQKHTSLLR